MAQDPSERNYKEEYRKYQGTPEQIRHRSQRNKARRLMVKRYGKSRLEGKDVGHLKPIAEGGKNAMSNLAIQSVWKNRGWEREPGDLP